MVLFSKLIAFGTDDPLYTQHPVLLLYTSYFENHRLLFKKQKQNLKHTDLPSFIQKTTKQMFERSTSRLCTASPSLCASQCFHSLGGVMSESFGPSLQPHVVGLFAFKKTCHANTPVQVFMKRFYSEQSRRLHLAQPLDETRIEEWLLSAVCTVSMSVCGVSL